MEKHVFLKHAGELCIFVLRRENWPITTTNHTPWARVGDGSKTQKRDYYRKKVEGIKKKLWKSMLKTEIA